jgi:hypothetical protein
MKTAIQCPNCQSHQVSSQGKTVQVLLGLGVATVGAGFFIPALATAVGYYLFALPLFTVGTIGAYQGYSSPIVKSHCKNCNHQFEYITG